MNARVPSTPVAIDAVSASAIRSRACGAPDAAATSAPDAQRPRRDIREAEPFEPLRERVRLGGRRTPSAHADEEVDPRDDRRSLVGFTAHLALVDDALRGTVGQLGDRGDRAANDTIEPARPA